MTRSAATMSWSLMICTGPALIPAKLLRVLSPGARVIGVGVLNVPPMYTLTVAVVSLTLAIRNCVSRSTLLYQGSQYVVSSWLFGSAIISEKLVLMPLTL